MKHYHLITLDCISQIPFWSHVKKGDHCWEWTASLTPSGYGQFHLKDEWPVPAHRASWVIHNGVIPDGCMVLHKCDNRTCVRPEHLFLGSHNDNMQDAKIKGRIANGEKTHHNKLIASQVIEIRSLRGQLSNKKIAVRYGVSAATIDYIMLGKKWKHLIPK